MKLSSIRTALLTRAMGLAFWILIAAHLLLLAGAWTWIGELAQDLRWHLGLATLAFSLGSLAAGRRARVALALLLGLWDLAPEARLYWPAAPPETHGTPVVLATANLLFMNEEHAELAAALRASGAEVIAVQELSLPMRSFLERELSELPHRAFSPAGAWNESTWGLGLFSRHPLRDTRLVWLDGCYASAIEARIGRPELELRVRVAHLNRPGNGWRCEKRLRGLRALEALPWHEHDVLLGDLNTTPSSPHFAHLLATTGLRDSLPGFGRQTSYWKHRSLPKTLGVAIDHALCGSSLAVLDRRIFELPGSDHAGVRVEIAGGSARERAPSSPRPNSLGDE